MAHHGIAGRISAAVTPNMVSLCTCGRAFFGAGVQQADVRLQAHVQRVTAQRQALGELLASDPSTTDLVAYLVQRQRED